MNPDKLSFRYSAEGYTLLYAGASIGGAGTKFYPGRNPQKHWRHRAADLIEHRHAAERAVRAIIDGHGDKRFLDAINKIDEETNNATNP